METEVQGNLLIDSISRANESQLDALWAILKYRDMGILRKVLAMCEVLNLDENKVVSRLPQDENGRIYDSKNRHLLSQALIKASQ
jgi:hypothetical protein|tara:strand:+ start:462 stop:716 length:255 start_codon:yes stop_codon:yes gene_type:complete